MAKKKQEDPPAGSPAWMATFSDLMNLLLCFFVLLFSMSSTDAAKFEMVVNSLKAAFSVMPSGGSTLTDNGALIGGGIAQLPGMSNYFGDSLDQGDKGDAASDAETEEESEETSQGAAAADDADQSGGQTEATEIQAGMTVEQIQAAVEAAAEAAEAAADAETQEEAQAAKADARAAADVLKAAQESEEALEAAAASQKAEEISEEEALEAAGQKELSQSEQMAEKIEKMTKEYGIQDLVEIDFNGQYVRVTLNGALLFESGSAELAEASKPLVKKMGKIIDIYQNNIVEVEGHTDNVPITSGRFESNDVLSMYRALNVADYLRENSNVPAENIVSSGRGAYVPVADNSTPEGRARNRRVEIKIYNELNSEEAAEE